MRRIAFKRMFQELFVRSHRYLLLLLIFGLLLRLLVIFGFPPQRLAGDEIGYWERAGRILQTGDQGTSWQPPGQSYLITAGRLLFGDHYWGPRILNLLAFLATITALIYAQRNIDKIDLLPFFIITLHPVLIGFSALFWSELTFLPILYWAVLLLNHDRFTARVTAGTLWGMAILWRQIGLIYALIFLAYLFWEKRHKLKTALLRYAPVVICMFLVLTPWLVRNLVVHRVPKLYTNGGFNLWAGSEDQVSPAYARHGAELDKHFRFYRNFSLSSQLDRDNKARTLALQFIAREWPSWLWKKPWSELKQLFAPENFLLRHLQLGLYGTEMRQYFLPIAVVTVLGEFFMMLLCIYWLVYCRNHDYFWPIVFCLIASLGVHLFTISHSRHRLVITLLPLLLFNNSKSRKSQMIAVIVCLFCGIGIGLIAHFAPSSFYSWKS